MYGLIEGCRFFNNNDRGISVQSSVPSGSSVIGLHVAHCRTATLVCWPLVRGSRAETSCPMSGF
jgi:parallel beta-helix repeat protein